MAKSRCPICNQPVDLNENPAAPFCSERCRSIDLRRWLDEKYSVPVERDPEDEEGESPPMDSPN